MSRNADDLARFIRDRAGAEPVALGLILGSGLSGLADAVEGVAIDYAQLPGFPGTGVSGHRASLTIGQLEGQRVAVFGGRAHYYEAGNPAAMRLPLEVLKALGAETLIYLETSGEKSVILRGDRDTAARLDDILHLSCLPQALRFFDNETGLAVAQGEPK